MKNNCIFKRIYLVCLFLSLYLGCKAQTVYEDFTFIYVDNSESSGKSLTEAQLKTLVEVIDTSSCEECKVTLHVSDGDSPIIAVDTSSIWSVYKTIQKTYSKRPNNITKERIEIRNTISKIEEFEVEESINIHFFITDHFKQKIVYSHFLKGIGNYFYYLFNNSESLEFNIYLHLSHRTLDDELFLVKELFKS